MATDSIYTEWLDNEALKSLVTDQHVALLVSAGYVPNPDTHALRADIPPAAIIAETNIQNPIVEQGRYKADDPVWTGVLPSTVAIESIVIINNVSGRIVAVLQTVAGLKEHANGNDIVLALDPTCGIFAL